MNDATLAITDSEFAMFQRLLRSLAGISLSDAKRALVAGRLARRLRHFGFTSYTQYYRLLAAGEASDEVQMMVDLLTTNETYFFREPDHFAFLREVALRERRPGGTLRIWSGASSTGEEAYSIAMVLADQWSGGPWEVFGSDISTAVLAHARSGVYPLGRTSGIPPDYLRKYCLKGVRSQAGSLMIDRRLQQNVRFAQANLTQPINGIGDFDAIFLRNVLIYFDSDTKRRVIENVLLRLKPGGYLLVGHAESLHGISDRVQAVRPAIYRHSR